ARDEDFGMRRCTSIGERDACAAAYARLESSIWALGSIPREHMVAIAQLGVDIQPKTTTRSLAHELAAEDFDPMAALLELQLHFTGAVIAGTAGRSMAHVCPIPPRPSFCRLGALVLRRERRQRTGLGRRRNRSARSLGDDRRERRKQS